ncbi:MAG: hypothetical protein ACPLRM_02525, partial [Anaerolineae bacterium]
ADLGVLLAIATAWRGKSDGQGLAAFGEVSLTGKVRYVLQGEKRVQELLRRGFGQLIAPARNAEEYMRAKASSERVSIRAVTDVREAVGLVTSRSGDG